MKTIKPTTPIPDQISECITRLLAGPDGAVWQHEGRWVYENPADLKPPQGEDAFDAAMTKMSDMGY